MSTQFRNIAPGHNIQQWKKLLYSLSNKASLVKFLVDEWKESRLSEELQDKELYATCEQVCFKIIKKKKKHQGSAHHRKKQTRASFFMNSM